MNMRILRVLTLRTRRRTGRYGRAGIGVLVGLAALLLWSAPPGASAAQASDPPGWRTDAATKAAAEPGGEPVKVPPQPVAAGKARASTTKADCDALIARVRAGKQKAYPRTCVQGSVVEAAWPSECSTTSGVLIGWTAMNRRQACNHERFGYDVVEIPSGRIVGGATIHVVGKMVASTSAAYWGTSTDVWVWSWWGQGFPESSSGQMTGCANYCYVPSYTYAPVNFDQWQGKGNLGVPGLATGQIVNNAYATWNFTFRSSKWAMSISFGMNSALSRCDNAFSPRAAGCVFGNIWEVVGFSQATVPEFVDHVYKAQMSGLPGRYTTNTFLTRLTDQTLRDRNGSTACPASIPRPPGKQCDEYPFRSTYQGAYTGGGVARSFPGCEMPDPQRTGSTGWSRCFINSTQNQSAGGTLGAFYSAQRYLARDPFQVGYLP